MNVPVNVQNKYTRFYTFAFMVVLFALWSYQSTPCSFICWKWCFEGVSGAYIIIPQ